MKEAQMKEAQMLSCPKYLIDTRLSEAIRNRNRDWKPLISKELRELVASCPETQKARYCKILQRFEQRAEYLMSMDNLRHLRFRVSTACDFLVNNADVLFATIKSARVLRFSGDEIKQLKATNEARTNYYADKQGELK